MTRAAFRLWLMDHTPTAIVGTGGMSWRCPLARWLGTPVACGRYERPEDRSWWPLPTWAVRFATQIDRKFPLALITAAAALAVLDGIPEETAHGPRIPLDPRAARGECVA